MAQLTWHGHSTFSLLTDDGTRLVIDPFFTDNPASDVEVDEVEADFILITHGHGDHISDALPLGKRTGATIIAAYEIVQYVEAQGLTGSAQSVGGWVTYPFGRVKMTPALHGGMVELPGAEGFTTVPAGFLIELNGGLRFHHTGDTSLLTEMRLLEGRVDVLVLPIGDRFTMGPEDAARAVEFIRPKVVIPCHYNTWPPIEQDPETFRSQVGDLATVEIMQPGDTLELRA